MTPEVQKISDMIADKESDDDELNARVWCWLNEFHYRHHNYLDSDRKKPLTTFTAMSNEGHFEKVHLINYTTSLDAAISIGADELEGWRVLIVEDEKGNFSCMYSKDGKIFPPAQAAWLLTMPRAICSARIQALDYERKKR